MTAIRNELANATEQTVLALKELETRIGVLKNDLAWLCQGLGHPEAARIAASPVPSVLAPGFGASFAPFGVNAMGQPIQAIQPFQAIQPGFGIGQPVQPIQQAGQPFGQPVGPSGYPTAYAPGYAATPFAAYAAPFASYAMGFPSQATPAFAYQARQPSFAYDATLAYR